VFIGQVRVCPRSAGSYYGVAKDRSLTAISSSLSKTAVNVLLRPVAEQSLPIITLPKSLDAPPPIKPRWVFFLVYWCKTSSSWLPQVPVLVMTSADDIERISAAATREDE
jgi:hypothetical protein